MRKHLKKACEYLDLAINLSEKIHEDPNVPEKVRQKTVSVVETLKEAKGDLEAIRPMVVM